MIVGASVLSCPSSSEIRGGGVGGGGGYRRQRRVTRDGAGGYVEESAATVELAVARAREYPPRSANLGV
jgi:hypothetical protein